jgi:hypothetical protein
MRHAMRARDYLEKALETRRLADRLSDPRVARMMTSVAEQYVRLAQEALRRESADKAMRGID